MIKMIDEILIISYTAKGSERNDNLKIEHLNPNRNYELRWREIYMRALTSFEWYEN